MQCPCCGAQYQYRVKMCHQCEEPIAVEDLLELAQLEFFLQETERLKIPQALRDTYIDRLTALKERYHSRIPVEEVAEIPPPSPAPPLAAPAPAEAVEKPLPAPQPAAPDPTARVFPGFHRQTSPGKVPFLVLNILAEQPGDS